MANASYDPVGVLAGAFGQVSNPSLPSSRTERSISVSDQIKLQEMAALEAQDARFRDMQFRAMAFVQDPRFQNMSLAEKKKNVDAFVAQEMPIIQAEAAGNPEYLARAAQIYGETGPLYSAITQEAQKKSDTSALGTLGTKFGRGMERMLETVTEAPQSFWAGAGLTGALNANKENVGGDTYLGREFGGMNLRLPQEQIDREKVEAVDYMRKRVADTKAMEDAWQATVMQNPRLLDEQRATEEARARGSIAPTLAGALSGGIGSDIVGLAGIFAEQAPQYLPVIGAGLLNPLAGAATGALLAGSAGREDAINTFLSLPIEQIVASPEYKQRIAEGMAHDVAIADMALNAGDLPMVINAATGGALGAVGPAMGVSNVVRTALGGPAAASVGQRIAAGAGGNAVSRVLGNPGTVRRALASVAGETALEAGQEGAEEYAIGTGVNQAAGTQVVDPWANVVDAGVIAAIASLPLSGVSGGVRGYQQRGYQRVLDQRNQAQAALDQAALAGNREQISKLAPEVERMNAWLDNAAPILSRDPNENFPALAVPSTLQAQNMSDLATELTLLREGTISMVQESVLNGDVQGQQALMNALNQINQQITVLEEYANVQARRRAEVNSMEMAGLADNFGLAARLNMNPVNTTSTVVDPSVVPGDIVGGVFQPSGPSYGEQIAATIAASEMANPGAVASEFSSAPTVNPMSSEDARVAAIRAAMSAEMAAAEQATRVPQAPAAPAVNAETPAGLELFVSDTGEVFATLPSGAINPTPLAPDRVLMLQRMYPNTRVTNSAGQSAPLSALQSRPNPVTQPGASRDSNTRPEQTPAPVRSTPAATAVEVPGGQNVGQDVGGGAEQAPVGRGQANQRVEANTGGEATPAPAASPETDPGDGGETSGPGDGGAASQGSGPTQGNASPDQPVGGGAAGGTEPGRGGSGNAGAGQEPAAGPGVNGSQADLRPGESGSEENAGESEAGDVGDVDAQIWQDISDTQDTLVQSFPSTMVPRQATEVFARALQRLQDKTDKSDPIVDDMVRDDLVAFGASEQDAEKALPYVKWLQEQIANNMSLAPRDMQELLSPWVIDKDGGDAEAFFSPIFLGIYRFATPPEEPVSTYFHELFHAYMESLRTVQNIDELRHIWNAGTTREITDFALLSRSIWEPSDIAHSRRPEELVASQFNRYMEDILDLATYSAETEPDSYFYNLFDKMLEEVHNATGTASMGLGGPSLSRSDNRTTTAPEQQDRSDAAGSIQEEADPSGKREIDGPEVRTVLSDEVRDGSAAQGNTEEVSGSDDHRSVSPDNIRGGLNAGPEIPSGESAPASSPEIGDGGLVGEEEVPTPVEGNAETADSGRTADQELTDELVNEPEDDAEMDELAAWWDGNAEYEAEGYENIPDDNPDVDEIVESELSEETKDREIEEQRDAQGNRETSGIGEEVNPEVESFFDFAGAFTARVGAAFTRIRSAFVPVGASSIRRAQANRSFYTTLADALSNPNDPFLTALSPSEKEDFDRFARAAKEYAVAVAEDKLTPLENIMPVEAELEGEQSIEKIADFLMTVPNAIPNGSTAILQDRESGLAYALTKVAGKAHLTEINYIPGSSYVNDGALRGTDMSQTALNFSDGPVYLHSGKGNNDSIFSTPAYMNGATEDLAGKAVPKRFPRFSGKIFTVGTTTNLAGQTDVVFFKKRRGADSDPAAAQVIQSLNETAARQKAGNAPADNLNPSTPDLPEAAELDALLQGAEPEAQAAPEPEPISDYQQRLNAILGSRAVPVEATAPDLSMARSSIMRVASGLRQQILRDTAIQDSGGSPSLRVNFTRPDYEIAKSMNERWSVGDRARTSLEDRQAPFRVWVSRAVQIVGGHPESHPVLKALSLMPEFIRRSTDTLYGEYVAPVTDHVMQISKRVNLPANEVLQDMGLAGTISHVVSEAAPEYERQLQEMVEEARALPVDDKSRQQKLLDAEARLEAYQEYQETGEARTDRKGRKLLPKMAGGMRTAERLAQWQELLNKGYTEEELRQAVQLIVDGYQGILAERIKAGVVTQAEVEQWAPWTSYVSLATEKRAAEVNGDHVHGIFINPSRQDFRREGSTTPAKDSLSLLWTLAGHAAQEIGGHAFRTELDTLYHTLEESGNTFGLRRISEKKLASWEMSNNKDKRNMGRTIRQRGGVTFRPLVTDKNGNSFRNTFHFFYSAPEMDAAQQTAFNEMTAEEQEAEVARRDEFYEDINKALAITQKQGPVFSLLAKTTKTMSLWYTFFKPTFAPVNGVRDGVERVVNVAGHDFVAANGDTVSGAAVSARMITNFFNPAAIFNYAAAQMTGKRQDGYWGDLYEEFKTSGGNYTYTQALQDSQGTIVDMAKKSVGGRKILAKGLKALTKWNDLFNAFPAFIQYASMRSLGMTEGDASAATLEFMNLHKEGTLVPAVKAFAPFVVPTIQGGANLIRALSFRGKATPMAKARAWIVFTGMIMAGTGIIAMLRGAAGDDDETGMSRWDALDFTQLSRGFPLIDGEDGSIMYIPNGFGMAQWAWIVANAMDRQARGLMTATEAAYQITFSGFKNVIPDTYPAYPVWESPSSWLLQTFSPHVLKPIFELGMNKNHWGTSIENVAGRPVGQWKWESGRNTTPSAWHNMARIMHETIGFDTSPEAIRHMVTYYTPGLLQGMVSALEADTINQPAYASTRQALGPWLTALGAGTLYSAPMNVAQTMFYNVSERIEREMNRRGVKTTSPDNRGNAAKADAFVKKGMRDAGFDESVIAQYMVIRQTRRDLRKVDDGFGKKYSRGGRFLPDTADQMKGEFQKFAKDRQTVLEGGMSQINQYEQLPSY